MKENYKGLVMFGPPGVGKGVQAKILASKYGLGHLSTGEIIRDEIKRGTEIGKRVQEAVSRGGFADDETVLALVMGRIDRPELRKGFIMDGFPRNLPQAEMFDRLLEERGRKVSQVIFLTASDDVVLKRLSGRLVCSSCGATYHEEAKRTKVEGVCDVCRGNVVRRKDDDPATQRERLRIYRIETVPLADYYGRAGTLRKVNGEGTIDQVAKEIAKFIDPVEVGAAR